MEKKSPKEGKSKTKSVARKPAAKSAGKPARAAKRSSKGDKDSELKKLGGKRVAMEKRAVQEKDSIAPPTERLVDAFSLLKGSSSQRRTTPVTRLPAGGPPAPRPAPVAASPALPQPAAKPSVPAQPAAVKAAPRPAEKGAAASVAAPAPAKPAPTAPAAAKTAAAPVKAAAVAAPPPVLKPAGKPAVQPGPAPQAKSAAAQPSVTAPVVSTPAASLVPESHPAASAQAPAVAAPAAPVRPALKALKVTTQVTVRELAEKMEVKLNDLIKKLMGLGVFATINQRLESDTAVLVAHDFGFDLEVVPMHMEMELARRQVEADRPESLKPRAPVVTIMGHVDHGKTSLLDAIRSSKVAEGESGGITQHIGAYKVRIPKGEIAFLDTPGHEAFTAMRSRGAKVTDIVVLVVSATDGVMPQTVEAIDHAKAAGVPIVVAVNKIDLPNAQPQKIRQELSQHGLLSEEWGGKNIFVDVSAKKRVNLDKLLEMLLLQAEVMELKANPDRPGVGVVVEARLDPRKGNVATVLVQNGTVRVGQSFVAGLSNGKVKALLDDTGQRLQAAGPSTPIELLGVSGMLPQAGDSFSVVSSERQAKEIAEKRRLIQREESLAHKKHLSLVGLKAQGAKELRLILKADVQGSIQAIKDSLEKLSTQEIAVNVIHAGPGNANESDVLLAGASDAVVLLFHAEIDARASEVAERTGVEVRDYEIIYDLLADVKAAMEGLLEPEIVELVTGRAEIRQIFTARGSKIAGCFVREGKVARGGQAKVLRGGAVVAESKVENLKHFKEDVPEVDKGLECGVLLAGFKDFQAGDVLEMVTKEKRIRRLESAQ